MLTGEAFSVFKNPGDPEPFAWQGTQVVGGQALLEVTAIGNDTRLWCWGDNDYGQLGGSPMVATGDPVLASTANPSGWTDIAAVALLCLPLIALAAAWRGRG